MRVMLAMYDPSQPSADGSFWSWRAPRLSRTLLDRLYYDVAVANRPQDPSQLRDSSIIGGFAGFGTGHVFAYRFGNGGRDAHGRSGRFVIIVACMQADQAARSDLLSIITCPVVVELLTKATYSRPVPVPSELEIDVTERPSRVDPILVVKALRNERLELSGPEAAYQAAGVCASLPADRQWWCRLRVDDQGSLAIVECPPAGGKPVLPVITPANAEPIADVRAQPAGGGVGSPNMLGRWVVFGLLTVAVAAGWWLWDHRGLEVTRSPSGNNSGQSSTQSGVSIPPSTREVGGANVLQPGATPSSGTKGFPPPIQSPPRQIQELPERGQPQSSALVEQRADGIWPVTFACCGGMLAIALLLRSRKSQRRGPAQ
jgi:hypothetical protein